MGIMNYCSRDSACALIKVENSSVDYIIFPLRSMQYCLDYFSIKIEDVDLMTLDYMDFKRSFEPQILLFISISNSILPCLLATF